MKISAFHLMPHRELPVDFEKRYESVWVTPPWWELADARRVGEYYNWTLDELLYAAKCGFDGVCTNEHHQNAYGFMPSPNIMGSVLAKLTNGSDVAIVQMGATLPTSNPPLRVAEEYAMLDCISGGRLVAGLPLGSPMDVNLCYGVTPTEHRERYREAFALTLKAWQAGEVFARNGPYVPLATGTSRPRRGTVRAARRVLLSQMSARACHLVLAARQPGLPKPRGNDEQSRAPGRESQDTAVPGLRRTGIRHRRQPSHSARSIERGSDRRPPRGQPHGAPADRLDAARTGPREHRPLRP